MASNHKKPASNRKTSVGAKPAPKPARKPEPKPASKPAAKPAAKPAPRAKSAGKPATAAAPAAKSPTMEKTSKKTALRDSILKRKAPSKPIAFSLDEVRAIAKTVSSKAGVAAPTKVTGKPGAKGMPAVAAAPKAKPQHVKAASVADILGFNPKRGKSAPALSDKDVPEKFKRFHKLLVDLRSHLTEEIERHSEETLKRSAKDDAGDLSAYGQHMADAGTDTLDRDFALSMVASEQEALSGTYGICEITQKPIAKERLLAVPFTRYSAEAQKGIERNRLRSRTQAGLFGEMGEEGGKMMDEGGGGDD